jgi:CHAT domain-containing protein
VPWAAVAATRPPAPAEPPDPYSNVTFCLGVEGAGDDSRAVLRLAPPPLDHRGVPAMAQAGFKRVLGNGPAASASEPPVPELFPGMNRVLTSVSPAAQLIFDASSDLLAGRHADAERRLNDCIRQTAQQGDSLAEATCANNRGVAYAALGQPARARADFERALQRYTMERKPPADLQMSDTQQASVNRVLGLVQGALRRLAPEERDRTQAAMDAQREQATQRLQAAAFEAWRKVERINVQRGVERSTLNLGNLALATGNLRDAQKLLQQALDSHPDTEPAACRAAAATDLARVVRRLGRPDDAAALLQPLRALAKRDPEDQPGAYEPGAITLASAGAGTASGDTATAAASPAQATGRRLAREPATKATAANWMSEPGSRFGDGPLQSLLAQAQREGGTADTGEAIARWQRLALRAAAAQRPDLAFTAHAALQRLFILRREPANAVFHGKRAANLAQGARANLVDASPSRDARRAFLRERRQVYVALAQALLDAGRLREGEATLQLLKEDEGQQFTGTDAARGVGRLALSAAEQSRVREEEVAAGDLLKAEQQRLAAAAEMPLGGGALLLQPKPEIEAQRLGLGLALPGLAADLKREPLRAPFTDAMAAKMLAWLQRFFRGPDARVADFLSHLAADAEQFEPAPSAAQRAQLAQALASVKQIQGELAPLLRTADTEAPAVTVSVGRKSDDEKRTRAWDYIAAEPLEHLWRSMRQADDIEARYLAQAEVADRKASGPDAAALPAADDETLALLARQPVPTALLYYLPGEDRLDILLARAGSRRHFRVDVSRAALDTKIDAFLAALRNSGRDPRPQARALYDMLFDRVAPALAENGGTRVVALSLAGRLRFVPFAALHDGSAWLVERHALALHPGGTLAGRLKPAAPNWQAAAFGTTQGTAEFPALANVRGEIASVVRTPGGPGGALPGKAWLDADFTAARLRSALGEGAQLLHIASHFKFVAGDAAASYLLLGDGNRLSLTELAGPQYRFDRTELVTLSACATGLSGDDRFFQEIDGLAALLMGQGAPSVLASLWEVDDASTATLMASLYRLREQGRLSRAVALQQAQLAMIRSAAAASAAAPPSPLASPPPKAPASGVTRTGQRERLPGEAGPQERIGEGTALGLGHPFYWAPFVLMGNWL